MSKAKAQAQKQVLSPKYNNVVLGTVSAVSLYIIGSWAIDSGSLWVYALTIVALYATVHFYKEYIRSRFFSEQKSTHSKKLKK